MGNTTIYLTRHGQTEWNVEKKLQGHKDSPLTELGIMHAQWLAASLGHIGFDAIYASSSGRTLKTAEILRGARSIAIIPDDDLREIHMGSWEGEVNANIEESCPEQFHDFWYNPHQYKPSNGGESFHELHNRVIPKIQRIIKENEGKTIFIVTHAATLKLIMTFFNGQPLADLWNPPIVHSTALCKVIVDGENRTVELYGDTSHYKES
jgi:probable phosphoglycerate mutase